MSASHILSTALFHGTMAKLKPGDVVEPREAPGYGAPLAFATHHHGAAKAFATDREGNKGHIYHVTPVDPQEVSGPFPLNGLPATEVQSKKGFKVVKKVPFRMSLDQQNELNRKVREEYTQNNL
jgi:hypothetical protein